MTEVDQGPAADGSAVLASFAGSLETIAPAIVGAAGASEALAELVAEQLAGAVGGTVLVAFHDEGATRLVACHPRSELAEALATPPRIGALVLLAGTAHRPRAAGVVGADAEREVLAVLADAGVARVEGLPLLFGGQLLGTAVWCLGSEAPPALPRPDLEAVTAVAAALRAASLASERERTRADQLQHALTSRIVVEQAKGMLAEQGGVSPDQAFDVFRAHCRRTNQRVQVVAAEVVSRRVAWGSLSPR